MKSEWIKFPFYCYDYIILSGTTTIVAILIYKRFIVAVVFSEWAASAIELTKAL